MSLLCPSAILCVSSLQEFALVFLEITINIKFGIQFIDKQGLTTTKDV